MQSGKRIHGIAAAAIFALSTGFAVEALAACKDFATVAGAAGGAYVGHQVEKNQKSTTTYQVVVKMDEGNTRTFTYANPTSYKVGDKVKILDKKLVRQ